MSIMERGGGIASTVKATRQMNFLKLRSAAEGFLKRMSTMGVTTVEGKSGYGLDRETELLQLLQSAGLSLVLQDGRNVRATKSTILLNGKLSVRVE